MPSRLLLACAVSCLLSPVSRSADWPGWRGPRGDGSTEETTFPVQWSATENVKWKAALPGTGHSSPIVARGKVFVTTCLEAEQKRVLLCLDRADGRVLWERVVLTAPLEKKHKLNSHASSTAATDGERVVLVGPLEKKHKLNSHASSTAATDGERVYVTFCDKPRMQVYCYDLAGTKLWEKSPGEFHSVHGFCSSPVLYKDLVILNGDQDAEAFIVALDKTTGEERWRIDRPNKLRSYCPPVIAEVNGKPQMVLTGSKCVASYDPDTGKPNWIVNGPTEQFVSSVVFHRGLVFLTAGYPERWVMAIDPTGRGDVTNNKKYVRWSKKQEGGYVPSPVAHDGHFYVVTDEGIGSCWEAKTGKRVWSERLGGHHSGSGVVAGGHVYFTDDNGETFVLKASPEFELVSRNPIGEHCYSSPAFSDGEIFLRGERHLFCFK